MILFHDVFVLKDISKMLDFYLNLLLFKLVYLNQL